MGNTTHCHLRYGSDEERQGNEPSDELGLEPGIPPVRPRRPSGDPPVPVFATPGGAMRQPPVDLALSARRPLPRRVRPGHLRRELQVSDCERPGSAYLLTWGRRHSQPTLDRLAKTFDVDVFVLGHQPQTHGGARREKTSSSWPATTTTAASCPSTCPRPHTAADLAEHIIPWLPSLNTPPGLGIFEVRSGFCSRQPPLTESYKLGKITYLYVLTEQDDNLG